MKRVLVQAGWLVTMDADLGVIRNGEMLLAGDRIEAIGRNLGAVADEIIDASDLIVMPGLINAHMHTWQAGLRGIGADWMFADYFRIIHGNLATRYRPNDNYLGNLMGAIAQIDAGVTTLVDWCHNITSLEHAERAVDGLQDSGIRAVFAHGTAMPAGEPGLHPFAEMPHPRGRVDALRKGRLSDDNGRVTLAMAILGPDYSTWDITEHDVRLARELGLLVSSHTLRKADAITPGGYRKLAKLGLLGSDHNVVHGINLEDDELKLLLDHGVSITSTVLVELHHHVANPVLARVRSLGGLPSIGIDCEPYGSGHMFREMQAALLFTRTYEHRRNALLGNTPFKEMPVRSSEALAWATKGGARAAGKDHDIGSLSPGKKADITMLRTTDTNLSPVYDPIASIVELASSGNVDTVIIDGIVRKRSGRLLMDNVLLRQRQSELQESAYRILQEGGVALPS